MEMAVFQKEEKMPLINLIIILVAVGVILWLVNNYIPMDRKIKTILNLICAILSAHSPDCHSRARANPENPAHPLDARLRGHDGKLL
jgi:hypothetical protein